METCKNGVEWFVGEGAAYTYVCNEHLVPAIKSYSDVIVRKVIGHTSCYWKVSPDSKSVCIATELKGLAQVMSRLAQEILDCE